jgi:nitronate monooxygenase
VRTRIFDIVRGYPWPPEFSGRALRNDFVARWHGAEGRLAEVRADESGRYHAAARAGDCDTAVVWASEAIDLIGGIDSAADIVHRISAEAESLLSGSSQWLARR